MLFKKKKKKEGGGNNVEALNSRQAASGRHVMVVASSGLCTLTCFSRGNSQGPPNSNKVPHNNILE